MPDAMQDAEVRGSEPRGEARDEGATGMGSVGRRCIRQLPSIMANQIAAGEVVERPASVVKELVENSLDAGATRVRVELERGGIELVRVSDDGCGIPADELAMALAPHATSKIDRPEDLDRITTMGFRGEALASIASVSRLSLRSRRCEDAAASVIACAGDSFEAVKPSSGAVGTCVTVRNLFFNTPARRKFLRTPGTEQTRCVGVVRDLAMATPMVGFEVVVDGRVVLEVAPGQSPRERVLALVGKELEEQLVEVHADEFDDARGLALWGLAGLPVLAKRTVAGQHVFVNGRPVRDRTIQHAIREAYRGLIEPGAYPLIVMLIEMDPGAVDVNVHPAKAEVRFRDSGVVHQAVLHAIREGLRRVDLTPGFDAAWGKKREQPMATDVVERLRVWPGETEQERSAEQSAVEYQQMREAIAREDARRVEEAKAPAEVEGKLTAPRPAGRVIQVHNSYLVTQDEDGVVIIDQHALHERVMFERLKARVEEGPLEQQRLLAPAVLDVSANQAGLLDDLKPLLEKIGIEAEALGPKAVGVHAFPSLLFERGVEPQALVLELLEKMEEEGMVPDSEGALHEVLDMMACKAAVKAGDAMSEGELDELLRLRGDVERATNCPHGRPTSVRLTIGQLEKLFGRT